MVDEDGNKLQYTAAQRKAESYGKRNEKILLKEKEFNKQNINIIQLETELSDFNSKTVNYERFKEYLFAKDKFNKKAIDFYQRDVWRVMKFRQYSYGRKSMDKFLNKIEEIFGYNPLIAYGNWSRPTQMKGIMPTKGKGLRKLIHKRFDTITVNEAYTSQNCCNCYETLVNYKTKNGEEKHRLLVCPKCVSSENKNIAFKTRDRNAAINILNLAREYIDTQTRPEEFTFEYQKQHRPSPKRKVGLSR